MPNNIEEEYPIRETRGRRVRFASKTEVESTSGWKESWAYTFKNKTDCDLKISLVEDDDPPTLLERIWSKISLVEDDDAMNEQCSSEQCSSVPACNQFNTSRANTKLQLRSNRRNATPPVVITLQASQVIDISLNSKKVYIYAGHKIESGIFEVFLEGQPLEWSPDKVYKFQQNQIGVPGNGYFLDVGPRAKPIISVTFGPNGIADNDKVEKARTLLAHQDATREWDATALEQIGARVQVFSRTSACWTPGVISDVARNGDVYVLYEGGSRRKQIPSEFVHAWVKAA